MVHDAAVELCAVTHRFGKVTALDRLTFTVPYRRVTVLLGPNGAGKTTAIRSITGALAPAEGHISVFGLDPRTHGDDVRPRCGVVAAKPALYDRLSGYDNLEYSARLYGVDRLGLPQRIRAAAARFGIDTALGAQVGGYSTGMKTRLALARAVLHEPELLLFDEPTSGLDPESAHAVLELISEMPEGGQTVVMCTHLLAEAEGLADHVVVMDGGSALVTGSSAELTARFWPGEVVLLDAEQPASLAGLADRPGVVHVEVGSPTRVHLDDLRRIPDLIADLVTAGVRLTRVEPHSPTLEDLYFAVRRAAEPEPSGAEGSRPLAGAQQ